MRTVAFSGRSGSGKTHLIERLVSHFAGQGHRVATVKHTHHHEFTIDQPGKDSWRHRAAGASATLLLSDTRFAVIGDLARPPDLTDLQAKLQPADILLVEGYASLRDVPRIEVFRGPSGSRPLCADDHAGYAAIATPLQEVFEAIVTLPRLDLDDTAAIASFILELPLAVAMPATRRRGPSTRLVDIM